MKILVLNPASSFTKNVVRDVLYGCWCKGKRIGGAIVPPFALLLVASILKKDGNDVVFLDAQAAQLPLRTVKSISKKCTVVIISTSTMSYNEDVAYLASLKKNNKNLISIVFGSHPTFLPQHALSKKTVDIIVRREPEYIIRDLISALKKKKDSWREIKGIGFRDDSKIIINDFYPFIENLDELPFLDVDLMPKGIDYFNPIIRRTPYITISTSRGCPGKCTFCTAPLFDGKRFRFQSSEYVLEELQYFLKNGFKEIYFRDDTFFVNKKRDTQICESIIKKRLNLSWLCNARVGMIDKEMMCLAKRAGCHLIKFGVESGAQSILNTVKKGITVEQIETTFRWAREVGINTHAHIMLGMPGDNIKTIAETIKFAKKIKPTTASFGICTPYPGSPLFDQVVKIHPAINDGTSINLSNLHTQGLFNEFYTDLSKKDLNKSITWAYRKFYLRPSYIINRLIKIRNRNELIKLLIAGSRIFDFSIRGE